MDVDSHVRAAAMAGGRVKGPLGKGEREQEPMQKAVDQGGQSRGVSIRLGTCPPLAFPQAATPEFWVRCACVHMCKPGDGSIQTACEALCKRQ